MTVTVTVRANHHVYDLYLGLKLSRPWTFESRIKIYNGWVRVISKEKIEWTNGRLYAAVMGYVFFEAPLNGPILLGCFVVVLAVFGYRDDCDVDDELKRLRAATGGGGGRGGGDK